MMKKILLIFTTILILLVGYAYISTKGDKSVKGNESFEKVSVGVKLLPFTLKDQFDTLHSLTSETKKIIFVCKKDSGHIVREYLNQQKDNYLPLRNILFVADISKMPSMIRELVAMPDLRKRDYPVLIVYNQTLAAKFKDEKNQEKIMVVSLEDFHVNSIDFVTDGDALAKLID